MVPINRIALAPHADDEDSNDIAQNLSRENKGDKPHQPKRRPKQDYAVKRMVGRTAAKTECTTVCIGMTMGLQTTRMNGSHTFRRTSTSVTVVEEQTTRRDE